MGAKHPSAIDIKILSEPISAGPTFILRERHDNNIVWLDELAGSVVTLPHAIGSGATYRFTVTAVPTSNAHIIQVSPDYPDTMQGSIVVDGDAGGDHAQIFSATEATAITLNGTTSGGSAIGTWIEAYDVADGKWQIAGVTSAFGVEVTPFSPGGVIVSTDILLSARAFALLGTTTITNTGTSTVYGDIGLQPDGVSIVGFDTATSTVVEGPTSTGLIDGPGLVNFDANTIYIAHDTATQAQVDVQSAWDTLAALPAGTDLSGQDLGTVGTLTPGVYDFSSSAGLTGTLNLVFTSNPAGSIVIRVGTDLTVAGSAVINVVGAGPTSGVYWLVGTDEVGGVGSATFGTSSEVKGNFLAWTSITFTTSAELVSGRAFAMHAAVTLDTNAISMNADAEDFSTGNTDAGSEGFSGGSFEVAGAPEAPTFTDEMARDALAAALVAGTGITIVVDDAGNTITINATGAGYDSSSTALVVQGAPAVKTVSATLTAAELLTHLITVNEGAAGASNLTLPLASALDTALPLAVADSAFDFSLVNLSLVAAEAANIVTNTGWTLFGNMNVAALSVPTNTTFNTSGRFRARKTGAATWQLYRLA